MRLGPALRELRERKTRLHNLRKYVRGSHAVCETGIPEKTPPHFRGGGAVGSFRMFAVVARPPIPSLESLLRNGQSRRPAVTPHAVEVTDIGMSLLATTSLGNASEMAAAIAAILAVWLSRRALRSANQFASQANRISEKQHQSVEAQRAFDAITRIHDVIQAAETADARAEVVNHYFPNGNTEFVSAPATTDRDDPGTEARMSNAEIEDLTRKVIRAFNHAAVLAKTSREASEYLRSEWKNSVRKLYEIVDKNQFLKKWRSKEANPELFHRFEELVQWLEFPGRFPENDFSNSNCDCGKRS